MSTIADRQLIMTMSRYNNHGLTSRAKQIATNLRRNGFFSVSHQLLYVRRDRFSGQGNMLDAAADDVALRHGDDVCHAVATVDDCAA